MRLLIKLSGEAMGGEKREGLDFSAIETLVKRIIDIHNLGNQISVVVGGGNLMRGRDSKVIERVNADYIGMMATIMNGLALTDAFNRLGAKAIFKSGIKMECFDYASPKDKEEYNKDVIIVYGGGIGKPYYSTDTCSAIRAKDLKVDSIIKLTTIDGVYTDDPKKNKEATKYDKIKFQEVIDNNLGIMDMEAIEICKENNIKIIVTDINNPNSLVDVINNKTTGTIITN